MLRPVAAELVASGCDYIQLDAPSYGSYCDPGTRARLMADARDIAAVAAQQRAKLEMVADVAHRTWNGRWAG